MLYSLTELIEKIMLGEEATIAFKREIPRRDSMADEIAAFANTRGGVILIGVDDNSEIVGLDLQQYSQATRNELLSRLLSEIALDDGDGKQVKRRHFLERRGEGVGIILNESEQLSGKTPVYELFNEELCLTIFAAKSLQEDNNYGKF